jgi:hypothetical protein
MKAAHQIVQEHVSGQIMRQKKIHDRNSKLIKYEPGQIVYVYFPLRAPGLSPKFTSQWRRPYKVLTQKYPVNYEVDCGRNGKMQVIHTDRMRPCRNQLLKGEEQIDLEIRRSDVEDRPVTLSDECNTGTVDEAP